MTELFLIIFITSSLSVIEAFESFEDLVPLEARLNFTELAELHGHPAEEYQVFTDDSYILKLFHIPGKRGPPILLLHGILDSSDTWIIRGKKSMAYILAEAGYDLWFGNCRGNLYSRRHVTLNPDLDNSFWDFSVHEHGYYDLSAFIDTVLNKTGALKLNAIGHSQGNAVFYVLGSTRPAYNEKVNLMIALAPICFLHHMKLPWGPVFKLLPEIGFILRTFGVVEFISSDSISYNIFKSLCIQTVGYLKCVQRLVRTVFGMEQPAFWPTIIGHNPHSISVKNLIHYGQVAKTRKFSYFDYGVKRNLLLYNSVIPPQYDLGRVSMRVALFTSKSDVLSTLSDVAILRRKLPNVVDSVVINYTGYNHLDFVWAERNDHYLLPLIFDILRKYNVQ